MPSSLPAEVRVRLEPVKLLVVDVDGVLTDGRLLYSATGELVKQFHVRDGLGIRLLMNAGIEVAVVTGRRSDAVAARCRELGLRDDLIIQGSRDKLAHLDELERRLGLVDRQVAAIGDDLPDIPLLGRVGFAGCPADAAPEVAVVCHLVFRSTGGSGVVREMAEILLKGQDKWREQIDRWAVERREEPPESGA